MEEDISLNTVANVANVSANHFSALFSQNMGQTFIEYLTTLRMNKAKELLRCTGMRSSEIAGEIGYKDAHYFSYLFKKTQGMTPSDYRKAREEKTCRGVPQKRKKQMGLEKRMNRLLFSTMIPMACLLVILLLIFWQYAGQYNKLSENLAVSSKFNLSFKDELDLEMYYLAIGSKEASELDDVLGQVEDAQNIMEKLRQNTYHASGVKCLNSLDAYLDNLKKRMVQLMEIKEYDRRMEFMDSNIRIITGLIMQEMQNYIYNESMYLVQVETSLTHRVKS